MWRKGLRLFPRFQVYLWDKTGKSWKKTHAPLVAARYCHHQRRPDPFSQMENFIRDMEKKFWGEIGHNFPWSSSARSRFPRFGFPSESRNVPSRFSQGVGGPSDLSTSDKFKYAFNFPNAKPDDIKVTLKVEPEDFDLEKRIPSCPSNMLISPSDSENEFLSPFRDLQKTNARKNQILSQMKANLSSNGDIDSENSEEDEIETCKRKLQERDEQIVKLRKKIKTLENELSKSKSSTVDNDKIADMFEIMEARMDRIVRGIVGEIVGEVVSKLQPLFERQEANKQLQAASAKNSPAHSEEKISLGPINLSARTYKSISLRTKHSMFVKDLVMEFWSEEELKERTVSGKTKSKDDESQTKKPLTPQKLLAIKDALLKRLEHMDYPVHSIQTEMKMMNRYIGEKINDLHKLRTRKSLIFPFNESEQPGTSVCSPSQREQNNLCSTTPGKP